MEKLNFIDAGNEVLELLKSKNDAYGSSVDSTYKEYGLTAYLVRMDDKLNRLKTLTKDETINPNDEKIEDTLRDMAGYAILAIAQLRAGERKSEFVRFAEDELNLLLEKAKDEGEESYNMQKAFNDSIMGVIKAFDKGEHSGFTASLATQYIDRLLKYRPLTHLTLADDEFVEVADGVFQNVRASNVFKQVDRFDGKPYCLDGPDGKPVTLEEYPNAYLGNYTKALETETAEAETDVQEA